jgi:hypothetical protein
MNSDTALMTSHNTVGLQLMLRWACDAQRLTMNSDTALMTSHNTEGLQLTLGL